MQTTKKKDGALAGPADYTLEKEAKKLYGLFQSDDLTDNDITSIVADARKAVYDKK